MNTHFQLFENLEGNILAVSIIIPNIKATSFFCYTCTQQIENPQFAYQPPKTQSSNANNK